MSKHTPQCPYCHRPLDPIWDSKTSCNRYACYVTRVSGPPLSEPISLTEGARLSYRFAARLRTPK